MADNNYVKAKHLFILTVFLLFLYSCASGSGMISDRDKSKLDFQIPELLQQEIPAENTIDLEEYSLYNSILENGPIIPGLFQGTVPQGMAYNEEADLMLISNYMYDTRPSCITAISMADGLLEKTFWLLNPDGTVHKGHVGGLAVSEKYLWIASGKGVYSVSVDTFDRQVDNTNLKMENFFPTAAKGSFSTFFDGILWIGEFTSRDGSYNVPVAHHIKVSEGKVNHAWMAGFILDSESDQINSEKMIDGINFPDYILSIPHEVQGAAFIDGKIYLSQSYGRKNNSRISVYSDPLTKSADIIYSTETGRSVPIWILDDNNLIMEIIAPPMSEGITYYEGALAVLYESGSDKYRNTAKNPQGRIHLLAQLP